MLRPNGATVLGSDAVKVSKYTEQIARCLYGGSLRLVHFNKCASITLSATEIEGYTSKQTHIYQSYIGPYKDISS